MDDETPGWCRNLIEAGRLQSGEKVLVMVDELLVEQGSQLADAVKQAGGDPRLEILPSDGASSPALADVDGDNRNEAVFGTSDGRVHATFTQVGTFVAVPLDPTLPSFTGHFSNWGNFNLNGKTVNGTFTFNVHGTGDDGSTFSFHENDHFNAPPDGTVHEFFHCHDS